MGNPANTNALICSKFAPSIPKQNFSALTRLDQNRAVTQIALKANSTLEQVRNVIIWGNHSATQYPDITHGTIVDYPEKGFTETIAAAIDDVKWLRGEFIDIVQKRVSP